MITNERAREWAEKKLREHHNYEIMSDKARKVWLESYMGDYMQIATEQMQIDIEKACNAHCGYCDHTCPREGECYILEHIRRVMEK